LFSSHTEWGVNDHMSPANLFMPMGEYKVYWVESYYAC
jgi:hypothetical protein